MYALKNDKNTLLFDRQNLVLTSVDWGAIKADHSTAKGINQIGSRLVASSLDDRPIEIIGFIKATSEQDMAEKKAALYQMCDPRNSFIAMHTKDIALECYATQTVKFVPQKLLNNNRVAKFVIDAVSYEGLFRDADLHYTKIAEWKSNFIFPLIIPQSGFTFSNRSTSLITLAKNNGSAETGMLIHFVADATVTNPRLLNIETGEFIQLNHTFAAGETVVVNTHQNQESVISYYNDTITDIINDFDLESTFLQLPIGETNFRFTAGNATAMTVTIYYYQRYMGV